MTRPPLSRVIHRIDSSEARMTQTPDKAPPKKRRRRKLIGPELDALCQVIADQVQAEGRGHDSRVLLLMGVPVEPKPAQKPAAPK